MTKRWRLWAAWAVPLTLGALLIVFGAFELLPHLKAPVDLVVGGGVLVLVGAVNIVRLRRRESNHA